MSRNILIAVGVIIVLTATWFFYSRQTNETSSADIQKKSPHFLDSTPLHAETYATQPINVTINFDFDLSSGSETSVTSGDETEWTQGEVQIEDNKTALKKDLKQNMPDGTYVVKYKACWPDGSCHDGQFSFKIDSDKKSEYQDMRGKKEVTVTMEGIKFNPEKLLISPGTKVIWENAEDLGHFVNTETHPEHTYFLVQNSRELKKGQTFSIVFEKEGQYNYHCSTHIRQGMLGSIIVSN